MSIDTHVNDYTIGKIVIKSYNAYDSNKIYLSNKPLPAKIDLLWINYCLGLSK